MSRLILDNSTPLTGPKFIEQLSERMIEDSAIPRIEPQIERAVTNEVVNQGACVDPEVLDSHCLLNLSEVSDPNDLELQKSMQRLRWTLRNSSCHPEPGSMDRGDATSDRRRLS